MHKNNLQGFAQRSNIASPLYQTTNEGQQHAPKFRSTVWVDGMSFTSQTTFFYKKAAAQEAARLALECLTERNREEGTSRVCEISTLCKALLNEYASKLNLERPTYNTVQLEGMVPVFKSSLVFNGMGYTGDAAKSKKEAEQLAARAVILSILGNSGSGTKLIEMIKSKSKLYDMFKGKGLQDIHASAVSSTANIGNTPIEPGNKDMGVAGSVANNNNEIKIEFLESSRMLAMCPKYEMPKQGSSPGPSNNNNETKIEFPESSRMLSMCPKYEMPKQGSSPGPSNSNNETKIKFPESSRILSMCPKYEMPKQESSPGTSNNNNETKIEFPESSRMLFMCHKYEMPKQVSSPGTSNTSDVFLQSGSAHSTDDSSSLKRRKKNKKANKKPRLESLLPIGAFPLNQDPCSVAQ